MVEENKKQETPSSEKEQGEFKGEPVIDKATGQPAVFEYDPEQIQGRLVHVAWNRENNTMHVRSTEVGSQLSPEERAAREKARAERHAKFIAAKQKKRDALTQAKDLARKNPTDPSYATKAAEAHKEYEAIMSLTEKEWAEKQ